MFTSIYEYVIDYHVYIYIYVYVYSYLTNYIRIILFRHPTRIRSKSQFILFS